ncbi:MAG: Glycosyl transferase family 2 [Candidatus Woesebacteria bacterium GW2011_GWC2_47_16]|uniref:Glycosyl transferase family 2 n=1 Tax=Candidatus Woesebacteria bacterium GW2011_GWC2_47_16 TaxID=1618590 RepID=A0A0G1S462_9BACT|nr:MAG: Glycosyl transferase family 2 [Candidatus Woesebacteria bacterium GW2011_GWC2_47_16]
MDKISVVINTRNEEKNLPKTIASVKAIAHEIVVVDMKSEDETVKVAKSLGARVYEHEKTGYVEPARNFAIAKTMGDWVLILDADEEIPNGLGLKLKKIAKSPKADYFRIPRKNIIFGKWIKHAHWWPDYNIRFFKKGHVVWNELIHSVPITQGVGADLPAKEELAIIHFNYSSIEQYLERMNRYSSVQARVLIEGKHKFIWKDLITKPVNEFLSRYFAGEGYKDGLHGLALSLLQAFSELIVYLKVWQAEKFLEQAISVKEIDNEFGSSINEIKWWLADIKIKSKGFFTSLPDKISRKLLSKNA